MGIFDGITVDKMYEIANSAKFTEANSKLKNDKEVSDKTEQQYLVNGKAIPLEYKIKNGSTDADDSQQIITNNVRKINGYPLDFLLPQYGVQDFINERSMWQKGLHNITGEPGWFYFKVFFHFNDHKGLFGGIMNEEIDTTSAIRYLYGIRYYYTQEQIMDRMLSLARFTYTLSYINSISPWFFIGINGLNELNGITMQEFGKEKSIDLLCSGDAIDMRLNTLLDMYKYACYDDMNCKEILPANLRKFDMSIVILNAPIKYFQTGLLAASQNSKLSQIGKNGGTMLNKAIAGLNKLTSTISGNNNSYFDYKTINGDGNSLKNRLSFQMYTLKNCEIDPVSFKNYMPSSLNNSQFSRLGTGAIKINYDRSYKHTFNEWNQMMYGSDGIYYDASDSSFKYKNNLVGGIDFKSYYNQDPINLQSNRISAIRNSIYNSFFDKDTEAYKSLIDFSEMIIEDSLINTTDPEFLGNIGTNYNENNYEDMWGKTKDKITSFFSKPLKF